MKDHNAMHILHLARWYPRSADPMLGLFIRNQVKSIPKSVRNTVLFVWPVKGQGMVQREEVHSDGLHEIYISYPEQRLAFMNFYVLIKLAVNEAVAVHSRFPVQLMHVHILTRMALVAFLVALKLKIPYVVAEQWSRYLTAAKGMRGFLRRHTTVFLVRYAKALITVSQGLKEAMGNFGIRHPRSFVVPNVVDTRRFLPESKREDAGVLKLVHLSSFDEKAKNIGGLLQAAAMLKSGGQAFSLDLIGDGPDRTALTQKVKTLELQDEVHFLGMLSQAEVAAALPQYDFMVQTSHYETFNTAVIEAWACGIPVVSTRVGVFASHYDGGLGVAIPTAQPDAIYRALAQLQSLKGHFSPLELHQFAERHFSAPVVGKALYAIYTEVLGLANEWEAET
jgi:glycosyltransferase involved in cell wall biosynthesis